MSDGFLKAKDEVLAQTFLTEGCVVRVAENKDGLNAIRHSVVALACKYLGMKLPNDEEDFLNTVHERVTVEKLNDFRLSIYDGLNGLSWVRQTYYSLVRDSVEILVGNELAMQKRINLSIQLPQDDSSILPVHSDVWSGDSPFEVVVWVPLVNCFGTKSMFLLPPEKDQEVAKDLWKFQDQSSEVIYESIESDLQWLEIPFGRVLVFSQNLMHGNRVNQESQTRWSLNCRIKSLFSPYAQKNLGEFFEPITIRPVTRLGMGYQLPQGFEK